MQRLLGILLVLALIAGGIYLERDKIGPYLPKGMSDAIGGNSGSSGSQDIAGPAVLPPAGQVVPPAKERPAYEAPKQIDFAFRRLEIDTSSNQPEACLVFTRNFVTDGSVRYEDYLQFDPQVKISVRPTQDRLCIAGLEFNSTYTLTLRAGLPAASGEKLAEAETIPVELRDRPATVAFGAGFILPRESADGVPVTTVNVDKLDIKVMRVGDRLLSQLQAEIIDQRDVYDYDAQTYADTQGSTVWSGTMSVQNQHNQAVTTTFAIGDALPKMTPGIYLIVAKDKARETKTDDYDPDAGQWIINTDIALTTFKGYDGLTVFARSFKTAQPMANVKLQLIAQDNEILGEVTTDGDGKAVFTGGLLKGQGGDVPAVVMAYNADKADFAYIDLRRASFDLSDRGVDGRDAAGDIDAFTYLDRGIYRPGETVQLTSLLRDRDTKAIANAPITVVVSKPDGQEFRRFTVNDLKDGAVYQPFTLSSSAPRGRWSASIFTDPNGAAIGSAEFDVQDFVPQKLKVTLSTAAKAIDSATPIAIDVESRFLYGAPASGLGGEGTLTVQRAGAPFPKFKDFSFGAVDELFDPQQVTLTVGTTDAAGKTQATGTFDTVNVGTATIPLEATAEIKMYEPGGRTTDQQITLPVKTKPVAIGIRPDFDYETVGENSDATLEIVAVNDNGDPIDLKGATYEFVRETVDYRWYQTDGDWKYDRIVRDRILAGGKTDLSAGQPIKLTQRVDWGSYRLTVADPTTGARTSVRFWAGWGANASDRPDRVNVTSDKQAYKAGETAQINVRPLQDGKALVVIAGDKIYDTKLVDVSASGTTIPVEVKKEWGSGVYAMVTLYRPLDSATKGSPRAIGLVHLPIDASDRTLTVDLGTPQKMLPRGPLQIPVTVANAGDEAYVTISAVDEGILQLTNFTSPDPVAYFFGKRKLGVDMRDDYGRLIETTRYQVGELRTGGDSFGGRSLAVVPQKTVALFSGVVKLEGGKGTVTLDVPDFNGELRVMAVAWSPTAVGYASKPVTVRDPVVAELVLPRFLAPGDHAEIGYNLHNVDGAPGQYTTTISAADPVQVDASSATIQRNLGAGERQLIPVKLSANASGIATIKLSITGPNGFKVDRDWPIEARPPQLPTSIDDVAELKAGETYALPNAVLASFVPGSASVEITMSGARGYDNVAGMLKWLDKYPYGCLEQTTSRALPLIYLADIAKVAGLEQDKAVPQRVQDAIDSVLDMERPEGSFGMWSSSTETDADKFVQMYAVDFLMQAKAKGYVVPEEGLNRALRYARQVATDENSGDNARAYAFYVLAKGGQGQPGDLRYYADNAGANAQSALGQGLMAGALVQTGDRSRAGLAFNRARTLALEGKPITYVGHDYYGTMLRDVAGLTAIAADSKEDALVAPLVQKVNEFNVSLNYTTTQEKSWMLLAEWRLLNNAAPLKITANGTQANAVSNQVVLKPSLKEVSTGVSAKNDGDRSVWRTVSATGVPIAPLPAAANGLTISKKYFNMDGSPANLATLKQNDQVIVLLEGQMKDHTYRQMAITDLLPAGYEIEGGVQLGENGNTIYPWLGQLTGTSIQENRDDRYVAAFTVGSDYRMSPDEEAKTPIPNFRFAYIVRATVPGTFALPGAEVEDMYVPSISGRTVMGTTTIAQ